jgi:hypothetical protein
VFRCFNKKHLQVYRALRKNTSKMVIGHSQTGCFTVSVKAGPPLRATYTHYMRKLNIYQALFTLFFHGSGERVVPFVCQSRPLSATPVEYSTARFLLPGRVDHGQYARAERFRQRRPSVDQPGQIGVNLRFTGQGMGQGQRGACRNWRVGFCLRRRGYRFNSRRTSSTSIRPLSRLIVQRKNTGRSDGRASPA